MLKKFTASEVFVPEPRPRALSLDPAGARSSQTPVIGSFSRTRHPFQPLCGCLITGSNLAFLIFAF